VVVGAQQPLAVQVRLAGGGAPVDARQAVLGPARQPPQPRLVLQRPDQLVALAGCPRIRPVDQVFPAGGQRFPDGPVPLGLPGVAADGEPLGPLPGVLGRPPGLLDPQVPGDLVAAALPGQRRGRLGVGAAQLPGADVVPAAAGQVRPVRRRGDPPAGDPDQPAQVPRAQVVLDGADDLLVLLAAGRTLPLNTH
jgi:hypothetical protein